MIYKKLVEVFNGSCLICGKQKIEFETAGLNFNHHLNKEHYFWDYVIFLMSLKIKPNIEFNSDEYFINDMIQKRNLKWTPMQKTMYFLGILFFLILLRL